MKNHLSLLIACILLLSGTYAAANKLVDSKTDMSEESEKALHSRKMPKPLKLVDLGEIPPFLKTTGKVLGIEPQAFPSELVVVVDGTPHADFANVLHLVIQLHKLQYGEHKPHQTEAIKAITFRSTLMTIAEIAALEKEELGEAINGEIMHYPHEYAVALEEAKQLVSAVYEPRLKNALSFKRLLIDMIARWANLRRSQGQLPETQSLLEEWSELPAGMERAFFREKVLTFQMLHQFILELKMFNLDYLATCKKSASAYETALTALQKQPRVARSGS